jgi:hypothetical protein
MDVITNLIGSVGFPIAVAIWLLWEMRNEREKRHEEQAEWVELLTELKGSVQSNTEVIRHLLDSR